MLNTTFQLLIDNDVSEDVLRDIEGITGNRTLYGLDTPIPLSQIHTEAGFLTALTCFPFTIEDNLDIAISIAIQWLQDNLLAWNVFTGSDQRINELVYACTQYQGANGPGGEGRVDYCGVPLDGGDTFTTSLIDDAANNLSTFIEDETRFPTIGEPAYYYRTIYGTKNQPERLGGFGLSSLGVSSTDIIAGPMWDYAKQTLIPDFVQPQFLIDQMIEHPTPDNNNTPTFLEQSASWQQQYITEMPDVTFQFYVYAVRISFAGQNDFYPAYYSQGAYGIGQAAIALARMVSYQTESLSAVYNALIAGVASYRSGKVQELNQKVTKLKHIRDGMNFPILFWAGIADEIDEAIIQAERERRAELLLDGAFIHSFDQDSSQVLSHEERVTMETEVKRQMLEARSERANELWEQNKAEMLSVSSLLPIVEDVFLSAIS